MLKTSFAHLIQSHQNKFHSETLRNLTARFASMREGDQVTAMDKELWEYFATLYKNSNKGIKGRGKDRRIFSRVRDESDSKDDRDSRSSSTDCSGHESSENSENSKERDDSSSSGSGESDDREAVLRARLDASGGLGDSNQMMTSSSTQEST